MVRTARRARDINAGLRAADALPLAIRHERPRGSTCCPLSVGLRTPLAASDQATISDGWPSDGLSRQPLGVRGLPDDDPSANGVERRYPACCV